MRVRFGLNYPLEVRTIRNVLFLMQFISYRTQNFQEKE